MIKVGIVGYGTIGKRVADAVKLQDDMELVGVTVNSFNYRVLAAAHKKIPLFAIADKQPFLDNGIKIAGTMHDLLEQCKVVVDCTPKKVGVANKAVYQNYPIKAIYQGGEKEHVGDTSFVAQANYDKALGKKHVRVVSCNTTGLSRTLHALDKMFGVESCRATLIRRAADSNDTDTGPINAIVPDMKMPSHHGPDVNTVLPHINIVTNAVIVPTTLMHVHAVQIYLKSPASREDVLELFKHEPRIRLISGKAKLDSTAAIMEEAKDLNLWHHDMMDVCIWDECLYVKGNEVSLFQAVHQESIVVPENIDAIRAVMEVCGKEESISKTNKTLGLVD